MQKATTRRAGFGAALFRACCSTPQTAKVRGALQERLLLRALLQLLACCAVAEH
jgi:hypothetical protein